MTSDSASIHLQRSADHGDAIARLAARFGGTTGLPSVLGNLNRQASKVRVVGKGVSWGFSWNDSDQASERWWPQGISSSADASVTGVIEGRRMLVTSWYSQQLNGESHGSRVTFIDLDTLAYRHVLLVTSEESFGKTVMKPLTVHAGGLVWCGPWLYVAGTRRGLLICHLSDLIEVEPGAESFGHRFVLPVRFGYDALTAAGAEKLRYSFAALDRSASPPELVAGEYGVDDQTHRLVRYAVDPATSLLDVDQAGIATPLAIEPDGPTHMQGAVAVDGTWFITTSHGKRRHGQIHVGRPGHLTTIPRALPAGPEDLSYWPATGELWSLTEYPKRRFVFCIDQSSLTT